MQLGIDWSLVEAGFGEKVEIEENAPMQRRKKQAGLEQRDRKQKNCYNEQKREASWIGGKAEK